jgi:hypothetical protein
MTENEYQLLNDCYSSLSYIFYRVPGALAAPFGFKDDVEATLRKAEPILRPWWAATRQCAASAVPPTPERVDG